MKRKWKAQFRPESDDGSRVLHLDVTAGAVVLGVRRVGALVVKLRRRMLGRWGQQMSVVMIITCRFITVATSTFWTEMNEVRWMVEMYRSGRRKRNPLAHNGPHSFYRLRCTISVRVATAD